MSLTMAEMDRALELIDRIYAAAAKEIPVSAALDNFSELIGDFGTAIYYHDPVFGDVDVGEITGVDPNIFIDYYRKHGPDNPLFQAGIDRLMRGEIVTADEIMTFEQLQETVYYRECLQLIGLRRSLACMVTGRGQKWASIATARAPEAGEYDPVHFQYAKQFQRHFARAMHILELFNEAELSQSVFTSSLERLPIGVMLVSDSRQILAANERARSLIGKMSSNSPNGKLMLGSTSHRREQFTQWWNILTQLPSNDGACYQDEDLAPIWEVEASRIVLENSSRMTERTWMITLKERPEDAWLSDDYLRTRFGLTRKEAAVCSNLCRSGDAVSVARALGLSPHTVRTHLKSAFNKTGTRNQMELALKLVSEGA